MDAVNDREGLMQELRLVTTIDEGTKLLLRSPDGAEFALPVDERLRVAARGDRVRFGQLEIEMDAPLRPRDIQARIRAGESAEQVAAASGLPLERVRRYEGPVLAEREHMASMARRTPIRGPTLIEGPPPLLGDIVTQRLRQRGVDADAVTWDSWRREDGRWQVAVVYQRPEGSVDDRGPGADVRPTDDDGSSPIADEPGSHGIERALFAFDPGRRSIFAEDDNARALTVQRQPAVSDSVVPLAPRPADGYPGESQDLDRIVPRAPGGPDVDGTGALGSSATRVGVPAMGGLVPLAPVPPRRPRPADVVTGRRAGQADAVPPRRPSPEPALGRRRQSGETQSDDKRRAPPRSRRPHIPASATAPIRRPSAYDERILVPNDHPSTRENARPTKRASLPSWDEILFGTRTQTPPD